MPSSFDVQSHQSHPWNIHSVILIPTLSSDDLLYFLLALMFLYLLFPAAINIYFLFLIYYPSSCKDGSTHCSMLASLHPTSLFSHTISLYYQYGVNPTT